MLPRPARDSASSAADAATVIPSTDSGVSKATHPGCPCKAPSRRALRPSEEYRTPTDDEWADSADYDPSNDNRCLALLHDHGIALDMPLAPVHPRRLRDRWPQLSPGLKLQTLRKQLGA